METRWVLTDTWNGGARGHETLFTSSYDGDEGYEECVRWVHRNKSYSFGEGIAHQGLRVDKVPLRELVQMPLGKQEIRELLSATLHGPLPALMMSRVFATLANMLP